MESKAAFAPYKIKGLHPLRDTIIVSDMLFDERISSGGIVLINDDMKSSGIRPRWAKVFAVGPEQKDVKVGQYILISHGRWTRGIRIEDEHGEHTIRKVDNNDVLMVSDEPVNDQTMSDKVY
jgi:co-chaperonin GroES (HSP10)